MSIVTDLVARISILGSANELFDFQEGAEGSVVSAGKLAAVTTAATTAMVAFVGSMASANHELVLFANRSGQSAEGLMEAKDAFDLLGGSGQDLISDLQQLNDQISDVARNGSDGFSQFAGGVRSANGDLITSLEAVTRIRDNLLSRNISRREAQGFLSAAGIQLSEKTIDVLYQSEDAIRSAFDTAQRYSLKQEDITRLDNYDQSVSNLGTSFGGLSNKIAVAFLPVAEAITGALQSMADWLNKLMDGPMGRFITYLGALVAATAAASVAVTAFKFALTPLRGAFAVAATAARALGSAFLFLGRAVLLPLAPFLLVGAGIASVVLLLQDLWAGIRGGDSLLAEKFPKAVWMVKNAVENLKITFDFLKESVMEFFGYLDKKIPSLKETLRPIAEAMESLGFDVDSSKQFSSEPVSYLNPSKFPNGLSAAGMGGNTSVTVQQNITSSDPLRAGNIAADRAGEAITNAVNQQSASVYVR